MSLEKESPFPAFKKGSDRLVLLVNNIYEIYRWGTGHQHMVHIMTFDLAVGA